MQVIIQLALLVIGFVMLVKGADWFVDGAAGAAEKFGVPQIIIGLTIVAMGTSAPEAAISISSALKGSAGIAVGNVLGSNIMNILLILGITAVITALPMQKLTVIVDLPFVIIITVILGVLGLTDNILGRLDGAVMWVLFIGYLSWLFISTKKFPAPPSEKAEEEEKVPDEKSLPWWKLLLLLAVGGVCIVWGSNITVDAATALAQIFGMSEHFIGVTIVAFGTSLPELVTSVTAALKKQTDIAIGNIVGSNIFNILFVIGTSAIIKPVSYGSDFLPDTIAAIIAAVLLLVCSRNRDKQLKRWGGILMLVVYAGYFVFETLM